MASRSAAMPAGSKYGRQQHEALLVQGGELLPNGDGVGHGIGRVERQTPA